ncbi:MAG: ABC transporter substrate-binding protein [Bacteroidota bacterium]|nr:ABC transporter substrate-binding protein [Bacteroidota bacterium]
MPQFTDQTGYTVSLSGTPRRIVSLVPSQTELLYDLGMGDRVIGITKFCVHPKNWLKEKTIIGGTKKIHPGKIAALRPDFILANKEENGKEQVESLRELAPVWTSDIATLEDACKMIREMASITGTGEQASRILQKIQKGFEELAAHLGNDNTPVKRVAYLIWQDPLMTVGGDTFIHDILCRARLQNVFAEHPRYPQITMTDLRQMNPDILFLSSEPYPFSEKHIQTFQQLLPHAKVQWVDGEIFSWYGSRLQYVPAYLKGLLASL